MIALGLFRPSFSNVALLVGAFLSGPALAQQVWTVDPLGPIPSIQTAVDLAADGDVILVRQGAYLPFDVVAKSLTLIGDPNAQVYLLVFFPGTGVFDRAIEVRDLGPNQRVVVRDLDFQIVIGDPLPTAEIHNCAGPVLFEGCHIFGSVGAAALVTASSSVTFTRCLLQAGGAFLAAGSAGFQLSPGLQVQSSNVFLFESLVLGSEGKDWTLVSQSTSAGGPGLKLDSGFLLAQGSSLRGGGGGGPSTIVFSPCIPLKDGGPGLVVDALQGSSRLVLFDTDVAGGIGGQPASGCPEAPGQDGPAQLVLAGQVDTLAANSRAFGWSGLVREGQSAELVLAGQAGEQAWLLLSLATAAGTYLEPLALAPHLDPFSLSLLPLPALSPSGSLFTRLTAPSLPVGVQVRSLTAQALFLSPAGELFLSGPSELRLLDAAF